ncbi:uncharacterized protein PRCAT00003664001 [Priceomyces carsonii]|uniref:uncharacterized protein n=1 Tax=Priceomyces carsonii TaxID=28549 RepID=UPI002ED80B45|nr:unnamed protein product [Priceomyces carsonii]
MDKFLMSSPRQLAQPFDVGNESPLVHFEGIDLHDSEHESKQDLISNNMVIGHSLESEFRSNDSTDKDTYLNELVPVSNNSNASIRSSNTLQLNNNDGSIAAESFRLDLEMLTAKFQHSKNISLSDDFYNTQSISHEPYYKNSNHQSKLSTSSMVSVNQDPPLVHHSRPSIHQHSFSTNTIRSADSVPALSSSISNQSLLDSPSSFQQLQYRLSQQQNSMATPRKIERNRSFSGASTSYATPLKGNNSKSTSPIAYMNNKVNKTPHSTKARGHERSRSRVSLDSSNIPLVTNSNFKSSPFQNLNVNLNNFNNSPYVSPKIERYAEFEELNTPLPTPRNPNQLGMYSAQQGGYFSPIPNWNASKSFSAPYSIKENDILESIKIEDQEDDALKELKKAKSYTNFQSPYVTKNLSNPIQFHVDTKDEDMFFNTAELSLNIASQDSLNRDLDNNMLSSNSTPGKIYSPPNHSFAIPSSYSVPSTSGIGDFDSTNSLNSRESAIFSSQSFKNQSIDLLLPQIITQRLSSSDNLNNQTKSLHFPTYLGNASFTKSYPASIDLASIATSPINSSISAPPTSTVQYQNLQGIHPGETLTQLTPSATFNQPLNLKFGSPINPQTKFQGDGKLPIKVSYKTDKVDPKKKHQCPICQARFQRPEHVKRHLKSHSSEKPFECDEPNCGKCFNRKDNLKAHLKKIHGRKL